MRAEIEWLYPGSMMNQSICQIYRSCTSLSYVCIGTTDLAHSPYASTAHPPPKHQL